MGHLAAWFHERPRVVEAVQLRDEGSVHDVAEFIGARAWDITEGDAAFYDSVAGTMLIAWGDWVVRLHGTNFEVVPAALFALVYEPSVR